MYLIDLYKRMYLGSFYTPWIRLLFFLPLEKEKKWIWNISFHKYITVFLIIIPFSFCGSHMFPKWYKKYWVNLAIYFFHCGWIKNFISSVVSIITDKYIEFI
jgi:hypothetical protein